MLTLSKGAGHPVYRLAGLVWAGATLTATLTFERDVTVKKSIQSQDMSSHVWGEDVYGKDVNGDGTVDGPDICTAERIPVVHLGVLQNGKPQPVASSESDVDSVQHMSFRIPEDGEYSLEVSCRNDAGLQEIPCGLAWRVE